MVSDILRDADEADEDFYVGELASRLNSDDYNDDLVVAELRARLPKVNTLYFYLSKLLHAHGSQFSSFPILWHYFRDILGCHCQQEPRWAK